MKEASGGVPRWIGRLHPGWMAVLVVVAFALNAGGYFLAGRAGAAGEAGSFIASVPITALTYAYAFLIATQVSGRFHSRRKRRLGGLRLSLAGVVAGFLGMPFFLLLGNALRTPITVDGSWSETGMIASWAVFVACGVFIMLRASLDLVEAERGFGGGTGRKLGTLLLFFFWIFGVFFIQARLRRLTLKFAAGEVAPLPMEKRELQELKSGRLALVLTEQVGGAGFESYGEELIRRLDGHVLKKIDLPGGKSWNVEIEGSQFRLWCDPQASRISLEGNEDSADLLLVRLQNWLAPASAA